MRDASRGVSRKSYVCNEALKVRNPRELTTQKVEVDKYKASLTCKVDFDTLTIFLESGSQSLRLLPDNDAPW